MSNLWHFKCLKCEEKSEEDLKDGDDILLNVFKHVDSIKALLDNDESGCIEISILGVATKPIDFLMEHYGEEHDVVVESEDGNIRRVDSHNTSEN